MGFKAYLINQQEGKVVSRFVDMDESQLDRGEVDIAITHSSINYKDALAATGAGRIIRRFPCVGGVDLAGRVTASAGAATSSRRKPATTPSPSPAPTKANCGSAPTPPPLTSDSRPTRRRLV